MSARPKKTQYKVFISSTFLDNKDRRKQVEDAIIRAGMLPIGMERFVATPRPTVEVCLDYVEESDVLVGIIASRYGWIPDGRRFSITELEYGAAKERLMVLRDSSEPVVPDRDFDQGPDKWDKQKKLEIFRARISGDQLPAVFTDANLGTVVLDALTKWREERETRDALPPPPKPPPAPVDNRSLAADIDAYGKKAESFHANLPSAGFVTQLKVPIDIEQVYIPMRAMMDLRGVVAEKFADAADAEKCLGEMRRETELTLPEAFRRMETMGRRGTVILGDPGSGKTTHLKRLLLWCLRETPDTIGLPKGTVPVYLPLRDLHDLSHGLEAFIHQQLETPHLNTPPGFGKRLLERGNLLLLLDGLDEVANAAQREEVSQWIGDAFLAHPSCRFVVTCRYAGYTPTVSLNEHFLEMHIRPLTRDQADAFVHNWYRVVETGLATDPEQAKVTAKQNADDLITRLCEPDFRARRVFELTRNPLLLTNICLVHRHRGTLPKKRAKLYEECIDVLLEHWRGAKRLALGVDAQDGRTVLQPVALWLHGEDGRTRATAEELSPIMEPALKAVKWTGGAHEFLQRVRNESGLLTGWDHDQYGFMHLGFQEYLAAREIRTRAFEDQTVLKELAGHFGESWWREVALLLLGLEDPPLFEPYMREVVKLPAFAEHADLIEECLDDAARISMAPFLELVGKEPGRKKALWQRQLAALRILERHDPEELLKLLERLRKHPAREIHDWAKLRSAPPPFEVIICEKTGYKLVRIPGGTFMMGSPKGEKGHYEDEEPLHEVHVPDFFMGVYSVTNEQYGAFLEHNAGVSEPEYWSDGKRNQPDQPVVGVSWDDAQLFAAWTGLRLPSEAEWEYACRARTQTPYWSGGNESDLARVGWYSKNSGGAAHPVGEKPPNDFGLHDMHGNVWEWVEDHWHDSYKGAPKDGTAWVDKAKGSRRVLRGGSWGISAVRCRSAFRHYGPPDFRYDYIGFRLSRSLP